MTVAIWKGWHPCPGDPGEAVRARVNACLLAAETSRAGTVVGSTVARVDRAVEEIVAEKARNHFVETIRDAIT